MIPATGRLPGVDGKAKMSKSQGNAIPLSASDAEITEAVNRMYTDPDHLRVNDPGKIEGNVVFTYLDAFDDDTAAVLDLKAHYRRGGLGDMTVKCRLASLLREIVGPIRERRAAFARDPDYVLDVIRTGTLSARERTRVTVEEIDGALGLFSLHH